MTTKRKISPFCVKETEPVTPEPGRASGVVGALDLCMEILQRNEQGEFYLPEDIVERVREL